MRNPITGRGLTGPSTFNVCWATPSDIMQLAVADKGACWTANLSLSFPPFQSLFFNPTFLSIIIKTLLLLFHKLYRIHLHLSA